MNLRVGGSWIVGREEAAPPRSPRQVVRRGNNITPTGGGSNRAHSITIHRRGYFGRLNSDGSPLSSLHDLAGADGTAIDHDAVEIGARRKAGP